MNATSVATLTALFTLTSGSAAHASGAATNMVFISGPLILLFLGFCALVVVAQIVPVISTLYGMIKSAKERKVEAPAEVKSN